MRWNVLGRVRLVLPLVLLSLPALLLGMTLIALPLVCFGLATKVRACLEWCRDRPGSASRWLGYAVLFEALALVSWGFAFFDPVAWRALGPGLLGHAVTWVAWVVASDRAAVGRLEWNLEQKLRDAGGVDRHSR